MEKNKENILERKKEIYNSIVSFKNEIKEFFKDNIINGIEFASNGCAVTFNKEHKNIKMILNPDDYEEVPYAVLAMGDFEKEEMIMVEKVLSYLPKKSICFDIGANVGWYTLHIKKEFVDMEVYSFEPSPITYERLCKNVSLNRMSENNCINIGFSKKEGKTEFYYDPNGSGASSMVNLREKDSIHKILVYMSTIDKWTEENEIKGLDFIKCDVEGAELFVYQGGLETIKKYKPVVFSEMLRKWSAKFGYHPNDIIHFLRNIGYGCFVITQNAYLKEIMEVTEQTVETNYFFLHNDKHSEIIRELVI